MPQNLKTDIWLDKLEKQFKSRYHENPYMFDLKYAFK